MNNPAGPRVKRRQFLKQLATLGAVVAGHRLAQPARAAPHTVIAPSSGQSSTQGQAALRIGLLLPQSTLYPMLDSSFLAGMELAAATYRRQSGAPAVQFVTQRYGTSPSAALQAARALLADGISVLSGVVSANAAPAFEPWLAAADATLLVADLGANVLRSRNVTPHVFRHSLNLWQANLALGEWAGAQAGKRAVIATSFYESGYDLLFAFQSGFEQAGGTVARTYVTHGPATSHDLSGTLAAIAAQQPDLVYAAYSGAKARAFLQAYAASELAGRVPLAGTAFLADEQALAAYEPATRGLLSASSWSPSLETPANNAFTRAFESHAGGAPDAFAVLGYDAGLQLFAALTATGGGDSSAAFQQALGQACPASPRGDLLLHAAGCEMLSPLVVSEARGERLRHEIVSRVAPIASDDPRIAALHSNPRSGWLNPFLAV